MNKNRYKNFKGYKFDRWIFKTAMIIIFVYLGYVAVSNSFDLDYFNCPINSGGGFEGSSKIMLLGYEYEELKGQCKNPFYRKTTWKNEQYLLPGEYGTKPGHLFDLAKVFAFVVLLLGLIINHLVHNKNFNLKEAML